MKEWIAMCPFFHFYGKIKVEVFMILKEEIYYSPCHKIRGLHIYLPDDYESSEDYYPVMYYFDGHNLFFDQDATYGKSWGLKDFLDGYDKKFIVVGIECGHEGNERLDEYCPYPYSGLFWGNLKGTGKKTLEWIVSEVKPMIDSRFRVYKERECTGIAGSSMGGLMSLYGIIAHNDVFSKAACLSSSIGPGMKYIREDIEFHHLNEDTKIYLSWGTQEASRRPVKNPMHTKMAKDHMIIKDLLKEKQTDIDLYVQSGGRHCEADWEKQNQLYYDYLWKNQINF